MSVISQFYNGVSFHIKGISDMTEEEMQGYIDFIKKHTNDSPSKITIIACENGMIDLSYETRREPFERIRRIR